MRRSHSPLALLERETRLPMATVVQEFEPATDVEYSLVPVCAASPPILLTSFPVEIGRGPDADVRLDDIYVSRRHCEIVATDAALVVHDLDSKNGTFVNGVRTEHSPLCPGDVLTLGGMSFVVQAARDYAIARRRLIFWRTGRARRRRTIREDSHVGAISRL
jgi:pSer/pThr/pTyr-binding forkhead associated (FHA) protein